MKLSSGKESIYAIRFTTREITLIGLFTAITAVLAQVSVIIPWTPVPITLQILAMCLSAAILGKKCGTAALAAYVLLGAAGAPVFANFNGGLAVFLKPTGGYIVSFPFAAFIIGALVERASRPGTICTFVSMMCGILFCYLSGTLWLGISLHLSPANAFMIGTAPFLPLDAVKAALAAYLAKKVREALLRAAII